MRKLFLFFLLSCSPAFAANPTMSNASTINLIATTTGAATTANGLVTAGDQLFVWAYCVATNATLTIADVNSGGSNQTWVRLFPTSTPGASGTLWLWAVVSANAAAVSDTVTVTSDTSCTNGRLGMAEAANTASGTVDQGPCSASGLTSASCTPANAVELSLGITLGGDGGTKPVAAGGATLLNNSNAGSVNPAWEYLVLTSCGGASTMSFTAGTGTLTTYMVTLKGTSAGASCGSVKRLRGAVINQ